MTPVDRPAVTASPGHHVTDVTPQCCNEPMVHNSATGAYECADAYFALIDEVPWLTEALLELLAVNRLPPKVRPTFRHWRESIRRCATCWPAEVPLEAAP